MSYTPHTWTTGETITASKMNNLENGVQSASGYDAEIRIYHDNNSSHNYEFTIVFGSYASLRALFENNIIPVILVRVYDDMANERATTNDVFFYSDGQGNNNIVMHVRAPKYNTGTFNQDWWIMNYLLWSPADELFID